MSVYLVEAVGADRVKIGYSQNPAGRIQSIATSSPFPIAALAIRDGDMALEKAMHRALADKRTTGEWFSKFDGVVEWFAGFTPTADAATGIPQRVHTVTVRRFGAQAMADMFGLSVNTVLAWAQRDSIPGEYWWPLAEAGVADLETMAVHAAANPRKVRAA
jgi:hypothetical protein